MVDEAHRGIDARRGTGAPLDVACSGLAARSISLAGDSFVWRSEWRPACQPPGGGTSWAAYRCRLLFWLAVQSLAQAAQAGRQGFMFLAASAGRPVAASSSLLPLTHTDLTLPLTRPLPANHHDPSYIKADDSPSHPLSTNRSHTHDLQLTSSAPFLSENEEARRRRRGTRKSTKRATDQAHKSQ